MKTDFVLLEENKFKPFVLKIHIDTEDEAAELYSVFNYKPLVDCLRDLNAPDIREIIEEAAGKRGFDWYGTIFNRIQKSIAEYFQ